MPGPTDWLEHVWDEALDDRERDVLRRRRAGETLDAIGGDLGVVRERVRQLQQRAERKLLTAAETRRPGWREAVGRLLADSPAVSDAEVAAVLVDRVGLARRALLGALVVRHPRTWAGELRGWWTRRPAALEVTLRDLAAQAPFAANELRDWAGAVGLPEGLPVERLLADPASPLLLGRDGGWLRRSAIGRDAAFLWLSSQGEPRTGREVAAAVGRDQRPLVETMRRDSRFVQVRPEGTWALADWRLPNVTRYGDASEAVMEVLTEMGPLTFDQLVHETRRRYPVGAWRISQCLSIDRVGMTEDGRYDLVERGAKPVEESEPSRPANMAVGPDGQLVGVRLEVTKDVVRGSGIAVNRWLTWYLGLRTVPSERHFRFGDIAGEVRVRRNTGVAQLSSLRTAVASLGLVEGCQLILLLRLDSDVASLRHACQPDACPVSLV